MTLDPYALPVKDSARLVGCKNEEQFLREVKDGIWPQPLPINSRPQRWNTEALKRRADELSGLASAEANPQDWKDRLKQGSV
jgi:hypothetical protein